MEAKAKMKVGMLFRTTADVDLSIIDLDDSPRYLKLGPDMYFRDYSKEYEDDHWDVCSIKATFNADCKMFIYRHPNDDFEAEIHLLLFDENNEVIEGVRLDYCSKDLITNELKYSKQS